jgi:TRAP-type mannitol/chloroaromatic compound transport system permease large subunit
MIRTLAPDIPLSTIFRGVMPFVASSLVKLALLVLFPILSLWLPQHMAR